MTTLRDIGLLRLAALRLVGPGEPTATDAVRRLGAVQAQDYPGALTSVALRTASRLRKDVVAALDAGEVVRSWPMRGTLHFVAAEDLRWFLDTVGVRTVSTVSKRWADLGLEDRQAERARVLVEALLADRGRASRAEVLAAMAEGGIDVSGQRGAHLIGYLALTGAVCLGPTDGEREQLYVRLDDWVPDRRLDREEALAELALRFFTGHGPATVRDLVRWAGSTLRDMRAGLAAVRDRLETLTVEDTEYLMDPATPDRLAAARAEAEGVLLLPGFDEFVLGYGDRTAVVPAEFADRIVPGGNGMFRATVVHGGQVVACWKWTGRGAKRSVAVEPFRGLPDEVTATIPRVAAELP